MAGLMLIRRWKGMARVARYFVWRCTHIEFRLALTISIFGPACAAGFALSLKRGDYSAALIQAAVTLVSILVFLAPAISYRVLARRNVPTGSHARRNAPWHKPDA
jgi:hypothetical protein